MANVLGMEFAPMNIPLKRRAQTFFVLCYIFMLLAPLFGTTLLLVLLFSRYWWLAALYLAYLVWVSMIVLFVFEISKRIRTYLLRAWTLSYIRQNNRRLI